MTALPECIVCNDTDETYKKYLLTCKHCATTYHTTCHNPPLPQEEVLQILQQYSQSSDLFVDWKCSPCTAGNGKTIIYTIDSDSELELKPPCPPSQKRSRKNKESWPSKRTALSAPAPREEILISSDDDIEMFVPPVNFKRQRQLIPPKKSSSPDLPLPNACSLIPTDIDMDPIPATNSNLSPKPAPPEPEIWPVWQRRYLSSGPVTHRKSKHYTRGDGNFYIYLGCRI